MKILIVDSNASTRGRMCVELRQGGYAVHEAESGEAALDYLAWEWPSLVLLDLDQPAMSGYETCERIRTMELLSDVESSRWTPVVVLSSQDSRDVHYAGFECGVGNYLVKPVRPGAVLATVNALLRPEPVAGGPTALIADDSPLVRRLTTEALTQLGLNVVVATDGVEAWELLLENPGAYDLVVTDFIMAELNGDELCRRMRVDAATAKVPILVVSALDSPPYREQILAAGASDFLPKPYVKSEFQAHVLGLLAGHRAAGDLRCRLNLLHSAVSAPEAMA